MLFIYYCYHFFSFFFFCTQYLCNDRGNSREYRWQCLVTEVVAVVDGGKKHNVAFVYKHAYASVDSIE